MYREMNRWIDGRLDQHEFMEPPLPRTTKYQISCNSIVLKGVTYPLFNQISLFSKFSPPLKKHFVPTLLLPNLLRYVLLCPIFQRKILSSPPIVPLNFLKRKTNQNLDRNRNMICECYDLKMQNCKSYRLSSNY